MGMSRGLPLAPGLAQMLEVTRAELTEIENCVLCCVGPLSYLLFPAVCAALGAMRDDPAGRRRTVCLHRRRLSRNAWVFGPAARGFTRFAALKAVLTDPKSYRRGIIRGLLFMPATVGNMIWGETFLKSNTRNSPAVTGSRFIPTRDNRRKESIMSLSTKYLGLTLNNPMVASASPLNSKVDNLRRLEDAERRHRAAFLIPGANRS